MSQLKLGLLLALLLGLSGLSSRALAQDDLEDIVQSTKQEEEELERLETELPSLEERGIIGRVRLPRGEEPARMIVSQDRPIDPEAYIVGPGDVLQLYIWGEFDLSYSLQVDPEGHILIPTVGDFAISGLSLARVRERIFAAAKERYEGVEMTLNMTSMRFFTVYITGAVAHEGDITVHGNNRVSEVIDMAGGFIDELRGDIGEEIAGGKTVTRIRRLGNHPTARRAIPVTHSDATVDTLDMAMFLATGDLHHNPYVRMGDRIHVNFRLHEVGLYGPFYREGRQEYREGDTIGNLVVLASGRRNEDPMEYAQVWRWKKDTEEYEVIHLAGSSNPGERIELEDFADFRVQPKDMVFVRTRSDWQYSPTVTLYGQVRYRGRYRIERGVTRLRDVIEMAGGFTEDASLQHAFIISTKHQGMTDPELVRVRALQKAGGRDDLRPEDKSYLKTKAVESRGKVVVDFVRLFEQGDETQNIVLQGGDDISIPPKRQVVKVSGAVETPGLVEYIPGQSVGYYLNLAGGYTFRADRDEARLIRARTGIRYKFDQDIVVEESDEVWIPDTPYRNWWKITEAVVNTTAQALTMLVVVTAFKK